MDQIATVHTIHNLSVYLKLMNHKIVAIYPVTMNKNGQRTTLYPFCPAYATTLCKAQGQTLQKLVVWFDTDNIPPGTAYVALSRVRCRNDIYFMTQLKPYFLYTCHPTSRVVVIKYFSFPFVHLLKFLCKLVNWKTQCFEYHSTLSIILLFLIHRCFPKEKTGSLPARW